MASQKTAIIYDPIYKEHQPGYGHPESPERCDAVLQGIAGAVPEERLLRLKPRAAIEEEIILCHTREYIELVRRDVASEVRCLSTGDTDLSERSFDAAITAVGGVLVAVDAVMDGTVKNAFCCVRPPGHHATPDRGMGFCIFNNAAIGARYSQKRHSIGKVLIVDWDVHHGNGTQEIFYDDATVFYFSTHQWPCYPGTGRAGETGNGPGKGFTLNVPFPPGSGRKEIIGAFNEKLAPAMEKFKPEFIFISSGFDSRELDPIGHFHLNDDDFAELTHIVMAIASKHAGNRIVSVLEGGYSLEGLALAAGAHVKALSSVL